MGTLFTHLAISLTVKMEHCDWTEKENGGRKRRMKENYFIFVVCGSGQKQKYNNHFCKQMGTNISKCNSQKKFSL